MTYPRAGTILAGKYEVEELLGAGGMGVVVAARHLQLDERVAIKLLLPEFARHEEVVARFLREGRAAIKIRSEHVVRILDVDALPSGAPYLVMECLTGYDFEALLQLEGRFAIDRAVDLLLQAGEAIAEAHTHGMVHRDLKPANLFLIRSPDESECVKILDFGISKLKARTDGAGGTGARTDPRITSDAVVMGSPQYMSPEQLRSTRDVDARTDIWALGTLLYELLTGAPAFEGESTPVICASVLKDAPKDPRALRPDLPDVLVTVIFRCLEKEPEARFANVGDAAAALAPFGTDAAKASAEKIQRILRASLSPRTQSTPAPPSARRYDAVSLGSLAEAAGGTRDRRREAWRAEPGGENGTTDNVWATPAVVRRRHSIRTALVVAGVLALTVGGSLLARSVPRAPSALNAAQSSAHASAVSTGTAQVATERGGDPGAPPAASSPAQAGLAELTSAALPTQAFDGGLASAAASSLVQRPSVHRPAADPHEVAGGHAKTRTRPTATIDDAAQLFGERK